MTSSGELYTFGNGDSGRMGLGGTNNKNKPQCVSNLDEYKIDQVRTHRYENYKNMLV